MNRRRNKILSGPWIFLLVALLLSIGCNTQSEHSGHEQMRKVDHDRKKITKQQVSNRDTVDLSIVSLPANYSVISSQKTVKPIWSEGNLDISANGYIAVDERRDNKVSVRFNGRIERLFVKYDFQYVKKGEKIMEVYSAELNTIQEELLLLLRGRSEEDLLKKAEQKLLLLGISDSQLKEIETSGKTLSTVAIVSPYEGYVYFTDINAPLSQISNTRSSQMGGMGMSGNSSSNWAMTTSATQIREGSYVDKGQTLFKVNDLKEVFGVVLIDNDHSSEISVGTNVELISEQDKGNIIKAKIGLIEPVLQNGQKFLSARMYLKNEGGLLKINSIVSAKIGADRTKQLMIPSSSILFTGSRSIVWIRTGIAEKDRYNFVIRDIATGISQGNMTEVISGLSDKEEIALDAGYMIDRESLIKYK